MILIKFLSPDNTSPKQTPDNFSRFTPIAFEWQLPTVSRAWLPPTDILDCGDTLLVRVEAAGMQEEDFAITASEDVLTIRGFRQELQAVISYQQMEIPFGTFELQFTLPASLNLEAASAIYQQGFLLLTIPKRGK